MFPTDTNYDLLALVGKTLRCTWKLDRAWDYFALHGGEPKDFEALAGTITGKLVIVSGNVAQYGAECTGCGDIELEDEMREYGGDRYCESCFYNHFTECGYCSCTVDRCEAIYIDVESYCEDCADEQFTYCEECEEYRDRDHSHGCQSKCEAPNLVFRFPANGHGTIGQDERHTVRLPAGTIDDVGMGNIVSLIAIECGDWTEARKMVEEVGPTWQTKRGNFTRRLSSAYYKAVGTKLSDGALSQVGNLARSHSSEGAEWAIEVTRDLNRSAEEFGNDRSCLWQSYYEGRCALKNWGGIGLRSFEGSDTYPSGRAWILPLDDDLKPTHNSLTPKAFLVCNGYGDLEGYVPARIVAYLTSLTYRKIEFTSTPLYVNSDVGYLVADEATCAGTDRVYLSHDSHDTRDAADHRHSYEGSN